MGVCCCLQTYNSVLNMLVMWLVLGPSSMVISIMCILLCKSIYLPCIMYYRSALLLFTCKQHILTACQVNGPNLGTKFHTYLLQFLRYWDSSWRTRTMTTRIILLQWRMDFCRLKDSLTHRPSSQGWAPGVLLFICNALCCFVWHCHVMCYIYFIIYLTITN